MELSTLGLRLPETSGSNKEISVLTLPISDIKQE
jgi:hypothetical protein